MESKDLLNRLKQSSPSTKLKWPETDEEITLNVATQQMWNTASLKASDIYKDVHISYHNMDDFKEEKIVQALYLCVKDSNNKTFCTISEFKKLITPELLVWLEDQHAILEEKYSPNIDNMSNDEFDKLITEVKKKPESTLSTISSIYTLRRVALCLVNPAPSLQMDS